MRPAAAAELAGIPSVVIANSGFILNAQLTAKSWGVDNVRIAEYPGALPIHSRSEVEKNIEEVLLERVINGLTREQPPAPGAASGRARPGKAVFTGTYDEINRYFSDQEWTDGLPIVPPTADRIEQFLAHTDRAPDEELSILAPAKLRATPRIVAANAIMAGCDPLHMPLLIAIAEALGEEDYNLNNIGSTSGITPFLFVNGPIVKALRIECGGQLVSKGPNPALGRAAGLMVRNIAGYRPGKNYMGSFGYPIVFALAENEDLSPWHPYHVDRGFDRSASTVTLGVTNNWGNAPAPASAPDKSGAQITLEVLCREIVKRVRLYNLPGSLPGEHAEVMTITALVSPPVAQSLADGGYSKQAVREYLYEHARAPRRDFEWARRYTGGTRVAQEAAAAANPDEMLRLLPSPDIVHIVVCGDPNRNRLMVFEGGHVKPPTRQIKFPPNWNELLKRKTA